MRRMIWLNRKILAFCLAFLAVGTVPTLASAAPIDLAAPGTSFSSSAVGDSRSVVLRDDSPFALSSFGVRMDPIVASFSLTAELFAFDFGTGLRGALLATSTQAFTDIGLGFYDVGISGNLLAGQFYELNLKPFGFDQFDMEFFQFNGPLGGGGDSPFTAGPVTVFDGCGDGNVGGCGNSVLAHFQLNGDAAQVPEPVTLAIFGMGLALLGFSHRRKSL